VIGGVGLSGGPGVPNASTGSICGPQNTVDCDPELTKATASEFELRNKKKPRNFVAGEIVSGGQLSFIIENLPNDGKGCPGKWLFDTMMHHFGSSVTGIQGNWTYGVNLATVNNLTAKGVNLEGSSKTNLHRNAGPRLGIRKRESFASDRIARVLHQCERAFHEVVLKEFPCSGKLGLTI